MINHTIHCHHCYESFDIEIDTRDVSDQIVWDCEICCNPNLISYQFKNDELVWISVENGNE